MDFVEAACVSALVVRHRRKTYPKFWVNPLVRKRQQLGHFHRLHKELRRHPNKFFDFYLMSISSLDVLLSLVGDSITYQNTYWRESISPKERLSVTLRQESKTPLLQVEEHIYWSL